MSRNEQTILKDREIRELNRSFVDEQRERAELHNNYD